MEKFTSFWCESNPDEAADEIDRLRRALLPFAINCDFYKPEVPHFEQVQIPMQFLRAARLAMPGTLPSIESVIG